MTVEIYIIRRRGNVGLRRKIEVPFENNEDIGAVQAPLKNPLKISPIHDEKGGAFGVIVLAMAGIILMILVFLSIADYSIYSMRRSSMSRALDFAVCAAVQEIDVEKSKDGLSEAFALNGESNLSKVCIDEERANRAFNETLKENLGISLESIEKQAMVIISNPLETGANYILKYNNKKEEGVVTQQNELEGIINSRMETFEGLEPQSNTKSIAKSNTKNVANSNTKSIAKSNIKNVALEKDRHTVYVNGNIRTNEFIKRPYYMVFIRNYQINGLFSKRTATFICFKGGKIDR